MVEGILKINKQSTVTSIGISVRSSSTKTPPSPLYRVGSKIKSVPEEKYNEELPAAIGYFSSYSSLVIGDDLNLGEMSGENFSLDNHTLSQHYCDSNNGGMSSGYVFLTSTPYPNMRIQLIFPLKSMKGRSIENTITKLLIE